MAALEVWGTSATELMAWLIVPSRASDCALAKLLGIPASLLLHQAREKHTGFFQGAVRSATSVTPLIIKALPPVTSWMLACAFLLI